MPCFLPCCRRLLLVALMILGVSLSTASFAVARTSSDATLDAQALLRDVLERVRIFYITPVDSADLMQTGLESMLANLDAESGYLPPGSPPLPSLTSLGEIPELGMIVTFADGMLVVVSPTDNGPAKEVGIRPKDRLYALGRTPLMVTSLFDGVKQLRAALNPTEGGRTKSLSFIVQHANQSIETIVISPRYGAADGGKEAAGSAAVTVTLKDAGAGDGGKEAAKDKIAVIRISRLPADVATQLLDKLTQSVKNGQNLAGVILDVRQVAGGNFDAALMTANLFMDSGVLAKIKRHAPTAKSQDAKDDKKEPNQFMADPQRQAKLLARPVPVVVVIDQGTADAAESLAAALQGNKRAVLVGDKSFGRATLHSQIALSNGGQLILATGRYLTPNGAVIEKIGLTPDIAISNTLPDKEAVPPPQTANTAKDKGKKPVSKDQTKPQPPSDPDSAAKPRDLQLERALDIVAGMALYRTQAGN